MVIGFITEGASEKIILESEAFRNLLIGKGIAFIPEVIDVKGGGKLLPEHREESVAFLKDKGATHVFIIADQEDAPCITSVKTRIAPEPDQIVIVNVKALEAWYLADTNALRNFIGNTEVICNDPENHLPPLDELKRLRQAYNKQGISNKKILAKKMLKSQFTLQNAALKSQSASYFLTKLTIFSVPN